MREFGGFGVEQVEIRPFLRFDQKTRNVVINWQLTHPPLQSEFEGYELVQRQSPGCDRLYGASVQCSSSTAVVWKGVKRYALSILMGFFDSPLACRECSGGGCRETDIPAVGAEDEAKLWRGRTGSGRTFTRRRSLA